MFVEDYSLMLILKYKLQTLEFNHHLSQMAVLTTIMYKSERKRIKRVTMKSYIAYVIYLYYCFVHKRDAFMSN